jgi:hypothetical protein
VNCFAAVVTSVRALSEDQSASRASFATSPFLGCLRTMTPIERGSSMLARLSGLIF